MLRSSVSTLGLAALLSSCTQGGSRPLEGDIRDLEIITHVSRLSEHTTAVGGFCGGRKFTLSIVPGSNDHASRVDVSYGPSRSRIVSPAELVQLLSAPAGPISITARCINGDYNKKSVEVEMIGVNLRNDGNYFRSEAVFGENAELIRYVPARRIEAESVRRNFSK